MYECFEERQSLWLASGPSLFSSFKAVSLRMELCRGGELYEYVAAVAQQKRHEGGAFGEFGALVRSRNAGV